MRSNSKERFPYFRNITFNKDFVESLVYEKISKPELDVFIYLYGNLTFERIGTSKKAPFRANNNGKIKVAIELMAKRLKWSRPTTSKATHKLIEYGLIEISKYGGNHTCHTYKILINCNPLKQEQVCKKQEEKWRGYSKTNNWKHLCPKAPKSMKKKSKDELTLLNGLNLKQERIINGLGSVCKAGLTD
tara:strand:- start:995 stop:1561 length:567 start_codon:yes stop_codon:yes gene_type:complete